MLPVTLVSKIVQVVQGCPVLVIAFSHCLEADNSWFSFVKYGRYSCVSRFRGAGAVVFLLAQRGKTAHGGGYGSRSPPVSA